MPLTIERSPTWAALNRSRYQQLRGPTSALNEQRRRSKVRRAMEWPKHAFARSCATTSASFDFRMPRPLCTSGHRGSSTTTRITPHKALWYRSPYGIRQLAEILTIVRLFGATTATLAEILWVIACPTIHNSSFDFAHRLALLFGFGTRYNHFVMTPHFPDRLLVL